MRPCRPNTLLPVSGSSSMYRTYYFRTHFTYNGSLDDVTSFTLTARVDDGAIVYLNGVPLSYIRMATSGVTYGSFTLNGEQPPGSDATSDEVWVIAATPELKAALRSGDNVLAAEVHQTNATSSDVVWGAKLDVVTSSTAVGTSVIGSYAQDWYYLASATDPNLPGTWTQYLPRAGETWTTSGPGLLYIEGNASVSPRNTLLPGASPIRPTTSALTSPTTAIPTTLPVSR